MAWSPIATRCQIPESVSKDWDAAIAKGKAQKRSPLFNESGTESGDVQIIKNNTGMLSNPNHNSVTHLTSTGTQQSVRRSKRPSSLIDEHRVEADRGKGKGVKRQKGMAVNQLPVMPLLIVPQLHRCRLC